MNPLRATDAFGAFLRRRPQLLVLGWVVPLLSLVTYVRNGFRTHVEGLPIGWDFFTYVAAAGAALRGDIVALYDPARLAAYAPLPIPASTLPFPFLNPPSFALALVPFRYLPYWPALVTWLALGAALLVHATKRLGGERPFAIFAAALASPPFAAALFSGQSTLLTSALVGLAFVLRTEGKVARGGALLGLLAYRPQLFVLVAIVHAVSGARRARFWFSALLSGAAVLLASLLVAPHALVDYVRFASTVLPHVLDWASFRVEDSLTIGAFVRLLLPKLARPELVGLALGCAVVALAYGSAKRCGTRGEALFPLGIFAALIVVPHAPPYEWVLLLPAFVQLDRTARGHRSRWIALVALLGVASFVGPFVARAMVVRFGFAIQPALPTLAFSLFVVAATPIASPPRASGDVESAQGGTPLGT